MKTMQRSKMIERIQEHGENLKRIYSEIDLPPITLCKKLRRLEREAHQLALECCEWRSIEDSDTMFIEHLIMSKLHKVLGLNIITAKGPKPFLNYDPRGYALKIKSEDASGLIIHKDWGGYGIIAPEFDGD